MNVLLCGDRRLFEILCEGVLKALEAKGVLVETNYEQVKAMAKAGEIENLIVSGGGRNWSGDSSKSNLILDEEALWDIYRTAPTVRLMGWCLWCSRDELPPGMVVGQAGSIDRPEEKLKQILEFLERAPSSS